VEACTEKNVAEVSILLVEDDEVDVKAVKRALRDLKIINSVTVAADGIEALEVLRGQNGRERMKIPFLILLDLNMPRMGGIEFLDELRRDPELTRSLVFVMTTSGDEEDRFRAYNRHVAGYMLKHSPARTFIEAVSTLEHYWRIIELPLS
jgi:CheY-like chemotaxis protein